MVFRSAEEFFQYSQNRCDEYEMFLDDVNKFPLHHLLLVGQTGSGKTYALYCFILQMLGKYLKYNIYFCDPKASSFSVLGERIAKENTAETIPEIIDLLRRFNSKMQQRKAEVKALLPQKWDGTYADFGLAPHVLIFDEYASFISCINAMDKKIRDEVSALLSEIVLEGRSLGFFAFIVMQKSDAHSLPTFLRDNLVCKIVLGQSERTTYETAFGAEAAAHVPSRKYTPGQGVYTYSGITTKGHPRLCGFPVLDFDVLDAVKASSCGDSSQD
jgi:DNA segregation ATPase FtsK/SpoIIIE-like protein